MIVLDTHALVWWVNGDDLLGKKARAAIDREHDGGEIIVSSIIRSTSATVDEQTDRSSESMGASCNWIFRVTRVPTFLSHSIQTIYPVFGAIFLSFASSPRYR